MKKRYIRHILREITVPVALTAAFSLASGCTKKEQAAKSSDESSKSSGNNEGQKDGPRFQARRGLIQDLSEWQGVVRASDRVEVRTDKPLKIVRVAVANLASVHRGDLLIELDLTEKKTKITDLEARQVSNALEAQSITLELEHKKKVFERKKVLYEKGIGTLKDFEDADREYKLQINSGKTRQLEFAKAKADLANAKVELTSANILAPADGIVSNFPDINASRDVAAGALVAVITNPGRVGLWVSVDELTRARLKVGQKATVLLEALTGKTLLGKVAEIAMRADANPMGPLPTYQVRVDFAQDGIQVAEGFRGSARIEFARAENAVVVPLGAVSNVEGKEFAVVSHGKTGAAVATSITTGIKTDDEIEVLSGINEGDFVMIGL